MAMSLLQQIITGLVTGMAIGVPFFGGLWWTARRIGASRNPALFALISLAVRMGGLAAGLYLISRFGPVCLAATAVGLLITRQSFMTAIAPSQMTRQGRHVRTTVR